MVKKRDGEPGPIKYRKLADIILLSGNPTTNISGIRKIDTLSSKS